MAQSPWILNSESFRKLAVPGSPVGPEVGNSLYIVLTLLQATLSDLGLTKLPTVPAALPPPWLCNQLVNGLMAVCLTTEQAWDPYYNDLLFFTLTSHHLSLCSCSTLIPPSTVCFLDRISDPSHQMSPLWIGLPNQPISHPHTLLHPRGPFLVASPFDYGMAYHCCPQSVGDLGSA